MAARGERWIYALHRAAELGTVLIGDAGGRAALHGWIIIDKPLGLGSTQVVAAVKRALRTGGYSKVKVGHGGTLDPLATGVLPIALGEATKLAGRMLDSDKAYAFTIGFGVQTSTLDLEGDVIASSERRPSPAEVAAVLAEFTGTIEQVPPAYSAILVEGRRSYDLARDGNEVKLAARIVTVGRLHVENPTTKMMLDEVDLVAEVSKGTYVRSLARDIALALGTVGHVTKLRRLKAGPFGLDRAISLDKLDEAAKAHALEDVILPLRAGLDDIPALPLSPDQAGQLRQGRTLVGIAEQDGPRFATLDDQPVALVAVEDRTVRVVRGFNL